MSWTGVIVKVAGLVLVTTLVLQTQVIMQLQAASLSWNLAGAGELDTAYCPFL